MKVPYILAGNSFTELLKKETGKDSVRENRKTILFHYYREGKKRYLILQGLPETIRRAKP